MNFEPITLRDVIYIASIICGCIATFLTTKHGLKDYMRDRLEKLKDDVNDLKIENERLKGKADLQRVIIDELKESFIFRYNLLEQANNRKL